MAEINYLNGALVITTDSDTEYALVRLWEENVPGNKIDINLGGTNHDGVME